MRNNRLVWLFLLLLAILIVLLLTGISWWQFAIGLVLLGIGAWFTLRPTTKGRRRA